MSDTKGTVKISENKIKLKTSEKTETYIKRQSINSKSWIVFRGDVYELELNDINEDEFDD